jgi:hypothetical protein
MYCMNVWYDGAVYKECRNKEGLFLNEWVVYCVGVCVGGRKFPAQCMCMCVNARMSVCACVCVCVTLREEEEHRVQCSIVCA